MRSRYSLAIWAVAIPSLLLAGCERPESAGGPRAPEAEIVHPIREALRSSDPTLPVSDVPFPADDARGGSRAVEAMRTFGAAATVGMAEGPDELTFGSLRGGAVLSDGAIAVVDRNNGVVRLFTASLEPREVIGGFGDGPGEFVAPVALFEEPLGTLVVLNHVGSRIRLERFRRGESGYRFHDRTLLSLSTDDGGHACTAEGRLFATGLRTSTLDGPDGRDLPMLRSADAVHEMDGQGRHLRSFAAAYTAPFERGTEDRDSTADADAEVAYALAADVEVAMTYARARLACGRSGHETWIWIAYSTLGEVHAWTLDGELRWIVRLPDMLFPRQVQRVYSFGTSVGSHPDQAGIVEHVGDIFLISSDLLALQIVSRGRDSPEELPFRTLLLDPVSGELLGGFRAQHRVLAAGHGTAVLYREELHPELAIVQLRR